MLLSRAINGRSLARLALAAAVSFGASDLALAADHRISPQTATFECGSVKPGDTLTLPSGARGPLRIRNCKGTQQNPIIVRNDPGGSSPAVIQRASGSGGFILNCYECVGVAIDGSYKWRGAPNGKTYGIKVTMTGGGAPTAFLKFGGKSRFIEIRNVEIDGAWPARAKSGTGIDINDHAVNRGANSGLWREDILIEHNYVHDVATEGMYIGPNYRQGDIPLRDVEIRHNLLEDIGFEAINTKSMWDGDNRIHHNLIRRAGKNGAFSSKKTQYSGIANTSGTVKIYNNWIETTGQHGIKVWTSEGPKASEGRGPFEAEIWNNVIVDAGGLWRSFMGRSFGINIGAQIGTEEPAPYIYNNTIVNSRDSGISVTRNVGPGFVRDNIIAGAGTNPVLRAPGFINLVNNRVGPVSLIGFVDPSRGNYRLKISSPARNQGSSNFPPTDHDDVARPKEGSADQGAFEGNN